MIKLNQILVSLIFIILIYLKSISFAQTKELISKNVSVIDGDTILLDNNKIRFSGIDAPESYFRGKRQICFQNEKKIFCGEKAKKKLIQKIGKRIVKCIPEKDRDIYNRILAECFIKSESLSVYMVKNGYAFDYPRYSNKKYSEFQKFAKQNKLGLWNMTFEYPWIWRKKNK
jgi:endonuclease YncB( thermonuclease family)